MSQEALDSWWLDTSGLPDLLWARLRVFPDGTAEVFDLDGRYTRFSSEDQARLFLLEDEYQHLEHIDASDLIEAGCPATIPVPPTGALAEQLTGARAASLARASPLTRALPEASGTQRT